jgi:transcriptional regulator with XRE-family HTH domain
MEHRCRCGRSLGGTAEGWRHACPNRMCYTSARAIGQSHRQLQDRACAREQAVSGASLTVRQRELGKRLRELRYQHGLTVEDVAGQLLCSATKVSRLETGMRRPSLRDVRDLCALYELDERTSMELMNLARGAREQGWWTQYVDVSFEPYIGLEAEATAITCYSMYYVPGLLQTEEYARAFIRAIAPGIEPEVCEQRVEVRLRRQQLLERDNRPRYRALLDEAVLYRRVGGAQVMYAQLSKILDAGEKDQAAVRVIPFDVGAHAAQDSNFVLLEFGELGLSPVVYVEGLTGSRYIDREADVARYRETVEKLSDSALNQHDSTNRLSERRRAFSRE